MSFFKQVLATIVGLTIFQIIAFIMFFVFIGILVSTVKTAGDEFSGEVKIEEQSVLVLDLARDISERDGYTDFNFTDMESLPKEKAGLQSIVEAIDFARTDDRVKGIYLKLSLMPNGYATIDVLREAIENFKTSDKFVIAYGEVVDQKSYYLSTVADKVYVNPDGYMEMRGIGARLTFYKALIEEKLEAEVQVFKVGDFKSAVEPFILDKMSNENRAQLEYLLGGIKEDFINNVAADRGFSTEFFDGVLNDLSGLDPVRCAELNLIDGNKYFDEVLLELKEKSGTAEDDDLHAISIDDYSRATASIASSSNKIAVIYAEGDIVDGNGDETNIGGEKFAKVIRKLRNDDDIDAIVLRVNSPGGSALASGVMWRELELAKAVKPVVVSMGDLAASGGYYIACNADKIFAEENTITGSIGVFGLVPNLEKFLKNKIGISFDDVKLNDHATSNGVTNKLSEFEVAVIQGNVEKAYETFTSRVAEGRGMALADVLAVAGGRVWTGQQAKEKGLVDEIGGLDDAIAYAAELAELSNYRIKEYPAVKSPFQLFFSDLGLESKNSILKEEFGMLYPYFQELKDLQKMQGKVQARIPYVLDVY